MECLYHCTETYNFTCKNIIPLHDNVPLLFRENKTRWILRCWFFCKQVFFARVDWIRDELWYVVKAVVIACVYVNASKMVIMWSMVPGEFSAQRPVARSFDVSLDLCLNKLLSKQSWGWWFETPSCPLWRHCNANHEISTCCRDISQ